jgi:small subunit ribosomal protein S20
MKRDRQAARKRDINQPHRSRAKTLVAKALKQAVAGDATATWSSVEAAASALDKAAKVGAIHPNAAARRKSRLMRKVNAALGGFAIVSAAHVVKTTGKAAAAKAARERVAASRAAKVKGEQTARRKGPGRHPRATRGEAEAAQKAPTRTPGTRAAGATRAAAAKTASPEGGGREGPGQGANGYGGHGQEDCASAKGRDDCQGERQQTPGRTCRKGRVQGCCEGRDNRKGDRQSDRRNGRPSRARRRSPQGALPPRRRPGDLPGRTPRPAEAAGPGNKVGGCPAGI